MCGDTRLRGAALGAFPRSGRCWPPESCQAGPCGQSPHAWDSEPMARNKDLVRKLLCAVSG